MLTVLRSRELTRTTSETEPGAGRSVRRWVGHHDENSLWPQNRTILPAQIRAWAAEHQQLFDLFAAELLASGNWPEISDLTRQLAREGRPTSLREIFWGMPKPLGFVDHNPERVRLSLFGLGLAEAARPLLDGFAGILRLAVERYPGPTDQAAIRRTDLAANGIADAQSWCSARSSPGRRHFWAVFRVARGTIGSVRWTTGSSTTGTCRRLTTVYAFGRASYDRIPNLRRQSSGLARSSRSPRRRRSRGVPTNSVGGNPAAATGRCRAR